jgi:hypothetical protein
MPRLDPLSTLLRLRVMERDLARRILVEQQSFHLAAITEVARVEESFIIEASGASGVDLVSWLPQARNEAARARETVVRAEHCLSKAQLALAAARAAEELVECVSAWKKDPRGGVIGVQKGPLC